MLRKQWAADHQAKLDKRAEEERMERRKIVLQRAIRLRERRQETARNLETQRIFREEQMRRYKYVDRELLSVSVVPNGD